MEKTITNEKTILTFKSIENKSRIKFYKKQNILEIIAERLNKPDSDFIDADFPPNSDSLYGKNNSRADIESNYEEDLKSLDENKNWTRTKEIFDHHFITKNDFSPFDIVQGSLSDCYYLSALASVAKLSYLILDLFVIVDIEAIIKIANTDKRKLKDQKVIEQLIIDFSFTRNKSNYYDKLLQLNSFYKTYFDTLKCFIMKIRIHGEWKYMIIDGYLPTYEGCNELIFAKSNSADLWVSLIEKVWAKVLGGYYKTSLGSPAEGFLSLTDSPTDIYFHSHLENCDELWDKIKHSIKENWILNCIIQLKGNKKHYYKSIGLVTNHCYSIIRLVEANLNGKNSKFLLLRNPYGYTNYSGNFSEEDIKWTDQLKNAVDFNSKDEGCFFVILEDYFKLFDHTFVNKHEEGKFYTSYKISKKLLNKNCNDGVFFLVKIKEEGKISFTLHQKYKRIYGKGIKNKLAQIVIAKISGNYFLADEINYVCGSNGNKSVNLINYFTQGNYLLYSRIETGTNKKLGFVISTYTDKSVSDKIEVNLVTNELNPHLILEKILISMCKENLSKDYYPKDSVVNSDCDEIGMSYKLASLNECDNGFGVIYIQNKNKAASINSTLTIKDFTGLEFVNLKEKINSNKQISIVTNCKEENLIFFKKMKMKCGFKISFSETFSFSSDYVKSIIKAKGEKKEILCNSVKSGVNIYSISHGKGYLFMVENMSRKTALVKIIFTKMENLNSKEIKRGNYESILKANSNTYIELNCVESGKPISIAYKYAASLK